MEVIYMLVFLCFQVLRLRTSKGKYSANFNTVVFVFGNLVVLPTVWSQSMWIYLPIKYHFHA